MKKIAGQILLSLLVVVSSINTNCSPERTVIATAGNRVITEDEFISRFKALRQKPGLPDNGQVREQVLQEMIDEELLIGEAEKKGFGTDEAGEFEGRRLHTQKLLNLYQKTHVWNRLRVEERDLQEYFIRLNTRLKARHLYASSQRQADSLYLLLRDGHPFEELARSVFKDARLRRSGGSIGYFTVDEMDAAFEDAAFSLQVGEISRPVRTAQGYSIIQLEDRIVKPILTENEFAMRRDGLIQYATYRKRKDLVRSFTDSLRRALHISFDDQTLHELLNRIRRRVPGDPENTWMDKTDSLDRREIARSNQTIWDVRTLKTHARFTSEEQLQWVQNEENLQEWISGLMIRDHMLSQAHQQGLDRSPEFITQKNKAVDDYLLKRMLDSISRSTVVPQDSLLAFYSEDPEQWALPPKIQLAEIALVDEAAAGQVKTKLKNGAAFEELALNHSVRAWSAENNGEIGVFTHQELGPYADRLFGMRPGQWRGPMRVDSLWIFFKCLEHYPASQRSFAQAKPELEKTLRPFYERRKKEEILRECKSKNETRIFLDRLRKLHI
jgi:parvulin-like peptidyl-prolyl isomerase